MSQDPEYPGRMRHGATGLLLMLMALTPRASEFTAPPSSTALASVQDPCYAQLVNQTAEPECITDEVCDPPESTWCCTHKHLKLTWKICGVTPIWGKKCGPSVLKYYQVILGTCQTVSPHGCVLQLPQLCPSHFEYSFTLEDCE